MTKEETFTEEQVQKRIKDAEIINDWRNAEDTIIRAIQLLTKQNIASGLWHPFFEKVSATMRSTAVLQIDAMKPQAPAPEKAPDKEPDE
jgi:hypothetical protein